jgi:hypothetical protein
VVHISPQIENLQSSPAEAIPKQGPAKKEGLGVFAKILAGLLRKAGEKDSKAPSAGEKTGEKLKPGTGNAERAGREELAALFSGPRNAGKKAAAAGEGEMAGEKGIAASAQDKTGARTSAAGEKRGREASAGRSLFDPSRIGEGEAGRGAKTPPRPESSPEPGEEMAAEGREGFLPPEGPGSGAFAEAGLDRAGENDGSPPGRRGKAGEHPVYVDSPERNFFFSPREAGPGQAPGGFNEGSGEKSRGEPRSRLAEARQKEKRKIFLEVRDFRSGEERNAGTPQDLRGLETRPLAGRGETEILVELRGQNPGRELPQAAHTWESRAGQSFEDFLARELHQNLNGDIVRHASVALRDGGEGTVRLSLRPESLGNVKIRLEMADNKVTGHIIVESEAALRAFEREIASLEQAFRDSGFDGANLGMSLSGGTDRGWNGEDAGHPALTERLAALSYDAVAEGREPFGGAAEAPAGVFTRNGRIAVNMLI